MATRSHTADRYCTIPGKYLELTQANDAGYDIIVETDGNNGLGPTGLARATPSQATYGKVNGFYGNVDGRIDFTISWDEPKTTALHWHYRPRRHSERHLDRTRSADQLVETGTLGVHDQVRVHRRRNAGSTT